MTDRSFYTGKVAIITGGASGIGAAIAKEIAGAGARVVLADRQVALAETIAATIRGNGGEAVAVELDVRDLASIKRVVADTVARWGGVHLFFNNAGIGIGGEAAEYEPRDWDDTFDVNLRGVAYGIQAVYPVMIQQGTGHIINTASVAGLLPSPLQTAYSATKHAVVGLSKGLRVEAKHFGVSVSVLCPGAIRTPILTGGKYGRINTEGLTEKTLNEFWERLRPMDVDVFARKVAAAVARNQAIIVVPAWWKALWLLDRISPTLSLKLSELGFARTRKKLEASGVRLRRRPSDQPADKSVERSDSTTVA